MIWSVGDILLGKDMLYCAIINCRAFNLYPRFLFAEIGFEARLAIS